MADNLPAQWHRRLSDLVGPRPDADVVVRTATGAGPSDEILAALSTGLVKVTTGTGVLSTAAPGVDYSNVVKVALTVSESDLTDAVAGQAQSLTIGALPANSVVLAHEVELTTQFTGGGATSVKLDVGTSGDPVSIIDQFDAFGATAGGKRYSPGYAHLGSHGDHVVGSYSAATLLARFTPDGGHTLAALTAGALTITVWYFVGA